MRVYPGVTPENEKFPGQGLLHVRTTIGPPHFLDTGMRKWAVTQS